MIPTEVILRASLHKALIDYLAFHNLKTMNTIRIRVRYSSCTYVAKSGKVTASSTSSEEFAALACARKCFPGANVTVRCIGASRSIGETSLWEGTAEPCRPCMDDNAANCECSPIVNRKS